MAANSRGTASSAIHVENPGETVRASQNAFNAHDLEGMVSLYAPEAVLVSALGQVTAGSESMREVFAGFLAAKLQLKLKITSPAKSETLHSSPLNESCGAPILMAIRWRLAAPVRPSFARHTDAGFMSSTIHSPLSNRPAHISNSGRYILGLPGNFLIPMYSAS